MVWQPPYCHALKERNICSYPWLVLLSPTSLNAPSKMATLLVRYLYKKYKARKAVNGQPEESTGPSQSAPQSRSDASLSGDNAATSTSVQNQEKQQDNISPDSLNTKSGLKWKLTLMVALLIPIFLETLDYTGKLICVSFLRARINSLSCS